jgi:hypothetical protein
MNRRTAAEARMKWVTLRETYPSLAAHSAKTSGAPAAHLERFEAEGAGRLDLGPYAPISDSRRIP